MEFIHPESAVQRVSLAIHDSKFKGARCSGVRHKSYEVNTCVGGTKAFNVGNDCYQG